MERPTQPGPVQPDLLPPPDGRMIKPVRAGRKIPRPNPTTLPAQQADLFALPLPPLPRSRFMPDEIRLSIVPSPEKLPADGQDAFLYMVVSQDTAQDLMATGLPLDRRAPLMLTERSGIPPCLQKQPTPPWAMARHALLCFASNALLSHRRWSQTLTIQPNLPLYVIC
ncbi:hypothetical protein [Acetobacter okinawensis]|uniref:hypothetical protein n=1 Tax=Acetobacter okinawensis TaxID=1076594 RepID=UPI000B18DA1B|nr:hypothetical protein [Acetobacter okinawensis]